MLYILSNTLCMTMYSLKAWTKMVILEYLCIFEDSKNLHNLLFKEFQKVLEYTIFV